MAKANPFRFSTKYQDDETDLLYYGYRYYNASTGRWASRDPMGEKSFLVVNQIRRDIRSLHPRPANEYGFVANDSLDATDYLGLFHAGGWGSCCCNGRTLSARPFSTGVMICTGRSTKYPIDHEWLEYDGTSAGFYPSGNPIASRGRVDSPDTTYANSDDKHCRHVKLSPCDYNHEVFLNMLKQVVSESQADPDLYVPGISDCFWWVDTMIKIAKSRARGTCGLYIDEDAG